MRKMESKAIKKPTSEWNFVEQYVKYACQCTDAPKEYHEYIGYCLLSAIVGRKILVPFTFGNVYPNLWIILLGHSASARKTTSIKIGMRILPSEVNQLAQDSTPEGLIESLSETPVGILARDELGGFLQNLSKKYMQGYKEFLNNLYDSPESYTRRLQKENVVLKNVCVGILGGTTPKRFLINTSMEDILSGFFGRFAYVNPSLEGRKRKPVSHKKVKMRTEEDKLRKMLSQLSARITKIKRPVSLTLSEDALKRYNEWLEEQEKELQSNENVDELSSVYSRSFDYAIKFAILEHVNNSLNSYNSSFVKFVKNNITLEELERGIELAERCLTYSKQLVTEIIEGTELTNLRISKNIERVSRMIKRKPGITRSELLRNTNILAREMDEIINTLHQRKEVEIKTSGDSKKKTTGYYLCSENTKETLNLTENTPRSSSNEAGAGTKISK